MWLCKWSLLALCTTVGRRGRGQARPRRPMRLSRGKNRVCSQPITRFIVWDPAWKTYLSLVKQKPAKQEGERVLLGCENKRREVKVRYEWVELFQNMNSSLCLRGRWALPLVLFTRSSPSWLGLISPWVKWLSTRCWSLSLRSDSIRELISGPPHIHYGKALRTTLL